MSSILDYWPFDYKRYFSEILPAFQQFAQGHLEPIQNLLEQAKAEDLPIFYKPTLSLNELEPIFEQHPEYRSVLHRWPRWSEEQYLAFMRNGFPRDEVTKIQKMHLETLWQKEDVILKRPEYAVTHGWGMLMNFMPGG
jgi:hypothetical protein